MNLDDKDEELAYQGFLKLVEDKKKPCLSGQELYLKNLISFKEIKELFNDHIIETPNLILNWHQNINSIDSTDKEKYLPEYPIIIKNINVSKLINSFVDGSQEAFYSLNYENERFRKDRIENILMLCRGNKKIIPPTIQVHPKFYGLNLQDGGHRMFCAIQLGQRTIPILINKHEKEVIEFILNDLRTI
ncbi:MAG: hypothetical protein IE931_11390 [Sphingobacteriales bacterium]|nr:hypothetical protein [Sphingobacteriales bacterium]